MSPPGSDLRELVVQLNALTTEIRAAWVILDAATVSGWTARAAILDAAARLGVFHGLPLEFSVIRYHSLVIQRDSVPGCLEITAETDEGEIMGVRHKQYPIWGVQFHPESILTEGGRRILKNFLKLK